MLKYCFEDYVMVALKATVRLEDMKDVESISVYSAKVLRFCDIFSQLMNEIHKQTAEHGNLSSAMKHFEEQRH